MTQTRDRADLYRAAECFVDAALRSDGSLFTPDGSIWRADILGELHAKFVGRPDESSDSFEVKLRRQLADASPAALQLMAEVLYVHFLLPIDIRGETKRRLIETVLEWSPDKVALPADLAAALDGGLVKAGTAYNTYRPFQLFFLVEFALAWKKAAPTEREAALADPWRFREMVWKVPLQKAQSQREGLLHLVFPDDFENIVSRAAKEKIATRFANLVSESGLDVDRQLAQIRRQLSDPHGPDFSFYDEQLAGQWQTDPSRWGQLLRWVKRFFEESSFDAEERVYKLAIADRVRAAREALLASGPWQAPLREAFRDPSNNLIAWQVHDRFLKWVEAHPGPAEEALRAIWAENDTVSGRIRGFLTRLPDEAVHGPGSRLTLASFLHMAHDPTNFPHYKETQIRKGCDLTGYPRPAAGADGAEVYEHALGFFDRLSEEASARGIGLRDRLDAQGALWSVVRPTKVEESFSPKERQALYRFLGKGLEAVDETIDIDSPRAERSLDNLADTLLIDLEHLRRIDRLLEDKGQVIFHGPPGTGKTYVAREFARFKAPADAIELVQFHPSYAYEDFVEGYRPSRTGGGSFILREGPLKRLAGKAAARPEVPHFLLIDEINRGNLAKVFGELYFLLEYRREQINLQYSDDPFSLPANLFVIGTMNTADRSIALVDLALRRRFHFVAFFPDEPPVQGLLRRWLLRHKPEMEWVADLVELANEILGNRHAAIGPSYFMGSRQDLDEERLRMIWEHSVLPYAAEQLFGGEEGRLEELAFGRLCSRIRA